MGKKLQDLAYCHAENNDDVFLSNATPFPKKLCFVTVPRLRPLVLLVRVTCC